MTTYAKQLLKKQLDEALSAVTSARLAQQKAERDIALAEERARVTRELLTEAERRFREAREALG